MKLRIGLTSLAVVAGVVAMNVSPALAHQGHGAKGERDRGARVARGFTCERGEARLARVENRIDRISARIDSGDARKPERAAKRLERLESRAAKIQSKIDEECTATAA